MNTRLIRSHELVANIEAWRAPEVSGQTQHSNSGSLGDQRNERQRAEREGFEHGRQAGIEAARREIAAQTAALEKTLDALSRPFDGLDQRFIEEIVVLVRAVTRQLVRRELQSDPGHIAGVVRTALAALPMATNDIVVRLHPDDAAALNACLTPAAGERSWRVEADPVLERGGCLVSTPNSQIDARLETRLGRVIAGLFADDRKHTNEPAAPDTPAHG